MFCRSSGNKLRPASTGKIVLEPPRLLTRSASFAEKTRRLFTAPVTPSTTELPAAATTSADAFSFSRVFSIRRTGLDPINSGGSQLRPLTSEISAPRIDSYRFSMANLEDSQDVDLDAILGELCALESEYEREIGHARDSKRLSDAQKMSQHLSRTPYRSPSASLENTSLATRLRLDDSHGTDMKTPECRTDSPDNDSAFSDTVSMLSSESSASSSGGGGSGGSGSGCATGTPGTSVTTPSLSKPPPSNLPLSMADEASRIKAEKIRMAMEKIREANIQKLFVKVFTVDGSAKSLLVDEKMLCSYVTRLLADKNHVQMDPKWAIVEHLPDLFMERIYEDHELLVENLMMWTRDSKNKIYFAERTDKIRLFMQPEKYLLGVPTDKRDAANEHDEHSRNMLLEEFFASTTPTIPEIEGPLYLKADSKKGWKKYNFVLRASGLYYYPKDKVKSVKDLVCLATFDNNQVYYGLGWKKKYKAPTDFCFAVKHPRLQEPKSTKYIKYLCAEDQVSLERWMVGMRIAKYGRQLMDNYRTLMDELAQEDLDLLAHARSCSVSSIAVQSSATTPVQSGYSGSEAGYGTQSETYSSVASEASSSGRHSRGSSSSSSGCMSDGTSSTCENAFDSEFPMGTIKRKPSMKPSLPLTNITRQLKEVGETRDETDATVGVNYISAACTAATNTETLTRRHSRRKSSSASTSTLGGDDNSTGGTLKRQHSYKSNRSSLDGSRSGSSTPVKTPLSPTLEPLLSSATEMMDSIMSLPPPPPSPDPTLIGGYQPDTDSETSPVSSCHLPPPPSPADIYNSNLSLDSLPPPPSVSELPSLGTDDELSGSQLSLMSLPPPPPLLSGVATSSASSSATVTPTNILSPDRTTPTPAYETQGTTPPPHSCTGTPIRQVSNCIFGSGQNHDRHITMLASSTLPAHNFGAAHLRSSLRQSSLPRQLPNGDHCVGVIAPPPLTTKKISFNLIPQVEDERSQSYQILPEKTYGVLAPMLPLKKPSPPRRSDSTRLSISPKKLVEPPVDFLNDLQRVMRKKWQVAQKCILEPQTTPHEVLGFRDCPPVLLPDYKEHNVSNWVQEHYGSNTGFSAGFNHGLYENVCSRQQQQPQQQQLLHSPVTEYAISSPLLARNRRPPPPPPKRSESTQLSTQCKSH